MFPRTILSMRLCRVILCGVAAVWALTEQDLTAAPGEKPLRIRKTPTSILVVKDSRTLFAYRRGDVEFKPYVEKLATPKGVEVLLDSPDDHRHHHGLMFAVGVDGAEFWSEHLADVPGAQRERSFSVREGEGDGAAVALVHELDWVDVKRRETVLTEKRTIRTRLVENGDVTLVTWTSQLVLPEGKDTAKLWGRHYFGLGLRFVRSMDVTGEFRNSSGRAGRVVRGDERLVPAEWCSYTAEVDGRPVTVAMFDHPENPRHATWFTMAKPFAYLSATLNLEAEPLTVHRAQPLRLCYAVALWDGRRSAAQVEELYRRWAGSREAKRSRRAKSDPGERGSEEG